MQFSDRCALVAAHQRALFRRICRHAEAANIPPVDGEDAVRALVSFTLVPLEHRDFLPVAGGHDARVVGRDRAVREGVVLAVVPAVKHLLADLGDVRVVLDPLAARLIPLYLLTAGALDGNDLRQAAEDRRRRHHRRAVVVGVGQLVAARMGEIAVVGVYDLLMHRVAAHSADPARHGFDQFVALHRLTPPTETARRRTAASVC